MSLESDKGTGNLLQFMNFSMMYVRLSQNMYVHPKGTKTFPPKIHDFVNLQFFFCAVCPHILSDIWKCQRLSIWSISNDLDDLDTYNCIELQQAHFWWILSKKDELLGNFFVTFVLQYFFHKINTRTWWMALEDSFNWI